MGFALYRGSNSNPNLPAITIWGTFPTNTFTQYVSTINSSLAQQITVNYVEKKPDTLSRDFVNALALGQGPDVLLITADMILPQQNKLTFIPYSALPQRTFMESYIDEADVYMSSDGLLAVPFTVDPLVMYWNRDTFNAAGIASYPKYWDEFTGTSQNMGLIQKLTSKDQNGNLRKTALAMGNFSNITNARELLGSLFLQKGNRVTVMNNQGFMQSTLKTSDSVNISPALKFFSDAVNPLSVNYSWNRGMQNDKTAFLSGTLATYFGFASELSDIRNKNQNLNFDVAPLPQSRTSSDKSAAYGKMYGFSLVRASQNLNTSYQVIAILTSPQNLATLSSDMYIPSVRNDIIAQGSSDPYITIFNQAALIAKTWLDIDPIQSRNLLSSMVDSVTSGQKTADQALQDTGAQYDIILRQAGQ